MESLRRHVVEQEEEMRVPAGAPVPFWLSVKNRLPLLNRFSRPTLGTAAVVGTLILTGAAIFSVAVYPKIENDYYKNAQAEERALLRGTREDLAHGQRMSDGDGHSDKEEVTEHEGGSIHKNDYSLDQFADDVEIIELNHTRADHVPDLSRFKELKELVLRTNLLKTLSSNLHPLTTLTELDLYENQIEAIENMHTLVNLKKLDLSFNRIREIKGLSTLTKLTHIYLVHNKITEIKGLDSLLELELLELGDNRIKKIENISHLVKLRELYLGKNKLTKIEGLDTLKELRLLSLPKNLRTVDVSNNNVTSLDGISELKELTDFWMGHHAAAHPQSRGTRIDVTGQRRCKECEGTPVQQHYFCAAKQGGSPMANDNRISNWAEVDKLRGLAKLDTVYLERNPIYEDDRTGYRRKVMLALEQVKQIDATMCLYSKTGYSSAGSREWIHCDSQCDY
ncbi:leucine Rich repeat-containing domain protein [Ancylostoma duodenale]|uniref:Leucine Rich repeat-containing domain protein n=1 Tax=Ancylostoma duodenale TaxID=51022 RepID=A0A0C2DD23_9BILA|nr:leucine Rich repeat-containing domain protein [Ancylostoma duodenale]